MKKILEKYNKIFFALVALVLLYPAFQKGYIFLLDGGVFPYLSFSDIHWKTDAFGKIAYSLLAASLSFGVAQRIFFFFTVYFLGTTGFLLAKKTGNLYARYFAGLFLIFNPFIYERLIEQAGIALGCAFFFRFLIHFSEYLSDKEKESRKIWKASLFAGLAAAMFAHSLVFVGTVLAVFLIGYYFQREDWKLPVKTLAIVAGGIILLNFNWLASFSIAGGSRVGAVRDFTSEDIEAFKTRELENHGVLVAAVSLQGYWGEGQERFPLITENSFWGIAFLLILFLAVFGAIKIWKKDRHAAPLAVLYFIALVLIIGVSSPLTKPLALFLYEHIPFYIGLREPQKWAAALVFIYAYFGSWGVAYLLEAKSLKKYYQEIGTFCLVLPIIFSLSMIRGAHSHFQPRNFPPEWYAAKKYLSEKNASEKILFFPWHSYLKLDFTGKNVTNPAIGFFGKNIIQGNNIEIGGLYSHAADARTLSIEKYILETSESEKERDFSAFVSDMKALGIGRIILAKTEDWREYAWLDTMKGVEKSLENNRLIIYELP